MSTRKLIAMTACLAACVGPAVSSSTAFQTANSTLQGAPTNAAVVKSIGTIKAINGNVITLAPETGPEVTANVEPNASIKRLVPGANDLKNATSIQLQDLRVGDKIRVRGFASADSKSISVLEVLMITSAVVAAVSDRIRQDWQKRGLGGLVSAVDSSTRTVSLSVMGFGGKKTIAVHSSPKTVFRRYAPDSVKFEDASPSSFAEIHAGDQLRARGERSVDGTEFAAEEIVTGRFRNIAGTINSVDASAGTVTVQDVLSKKTVQVKVTPDSQLHQLPAEMAQRMAARLKASIAGSMPAGMPGAGAASSGQNGTGAGAVAREANTGGPGTSGGGMSGARTGAPDIQQLLNRLPAVALTDLHKGDAIMLVTTQGTPSNPSTAITLLSGVEAILQAAPNANQAMMLTPWSLGGMPGGDSGSQ
jgi:Domain of unknown function (DUF5666)